MKRLLGIALLLAVLIGALSSHAKSGPATTTASNEPAPAATSATRTEPKRQSAHQSYTRCDQNISAGPHTTCGFADNVFRAFAREVSNAGSSPANYTVQATSPVTGKTYSMSCRTPEETTMCSGARGARVRFTLSAAEVYYRPSTPSHESAPSHQGEESESEEPEETESSTPEPSAECTNGTYVNSAGNTVCSPEEAPTAPAGATAECQDGTYSFSESRSGTCSYHGGVAKWL